MFGLFGIGGLVFGGRNRSFGSRRSGQFSDPDEEYEEAYEEWHERTMERENRRNYGSDSDEVSSDEEPPSRPPPNKNKPKLKYDEEDRNDDSDSSSNEDDDEDDVVKLVSNFEDTGSYLKIRDIKWDVAVMRFRAEPMKKMFYRSPVYVSGFYNQFQVFFIMEKFGSQFGVYACELSKYGKATYETSIRHYKGHKERLSKKDTICPKKKGFRFLGYVDLVERDEREWDC